SLSANSPTSSSESSNCSEFPPATITGDLRTRPKFGENGNALLGKGVGPVFPSGLLRSYLVWLASLLVVGDWAYQVHSRLFDLSEHDFDVMNYYGLACTKMCTFLFFLGPYIAVRLVQMGMRKASPTGK
ncbi:MAG: DUF6868 family protein, partial [Planctomycetota bacterium]